MEKKTDLLLATRNPHKTRELAQIIGDRFRISDLMEYPELPRLIESGKTFEENAILKALTVSRDRQAKDRHLLVVADDSGLEVDALAGAPGIYSARYAGEKATDQQNIDKLLRELARQDMATSLKTARFRCAIALAHDGKLLGTFEGRTEGTIVDPPRGRKGFGYDPIFRPDGFEPTFAELPSEIKNQISHRALAVFKLVDYLNIARPLGQK